MTKTFKPTSKESHVWLTVQDRDASGKLVLKNHKLLKDKVLRLDDWQMTNDVKNKLSLGLVSEVKSTTVASR